MADDFDGLPPGLFTFFEDLEHNNTKEYWAANKARWEDDVRGPMRALLRELEDEFPPLRLFRPNRDLRYTRDKSPYKLSTGATSDATPVGGSGYHLHMDADGLTIACGAMVMSLAELQRFRESIGDDHRGGQFESLADKLASASLPVTPGFHPALKRVPSGYPADYRRADLLRWKGAAMSVEFETAPWMHTHDVADKIRQAWRTAQPLMDWLEAHVIVDIRSP